MEDPKDPREKRKPPQPLLSHLTAQVSAQTQEGVLHPMGYAWIRGFGFLGSSPTSEQSDQPLTWTDALATLAFYEQIRGQRPPSMRFDVRGEVCYLLAANGARLRSEPKPMHGAIEVTYSRDAWLAMHKNLKTADIDR